MTFEEEVADPYVSLLTAEQLRGLHSHFDENKDGKVSFMEVMDYSKRIAKAMASKETAPMLKRMDSSKDGSVSLKEHLEDIEKGSVMAVGSKAEADKEIEYQRALESKKFAAADTNGDQALDTSELTALLFPGAHDHMVDLISRETMTLRDTDGDGKLSAHEFWELTGFRDDGEFSKEEKQRFARLDSDRDGFLSLEELRDWESGVLHTEEAMRTLLEIADQDSDRYVTADELVSAQEQIKESQSQRHLVDWASHHEL